MRLLVLGASGGCGRWVTRLAAAEDEVTALVRPQTAFEPPPGVRVERGSVLQTADVERAVAGQQAVISCVGAPAGQCPQSVVAAAAAGVGESLPDTNAMMRWLLRSSTIGEMYADLEAMEAVYRARASTGWRCGR